jgi:hypothetical protein
MVPSSGYSIHARPRLQQNYTCRRRIALMGNLIARIKKLLGLDKKPTGTT